MRRSWMVGAVGLAVLVFATTAVAAVVGNFPADAVRDEQWSDARLGHDDERLDD